MNYRSCVRFPAAFAKACLLPVFLLVLTLGASALAQEAATGTIVGRVLNAANGKYLNKAQVTVVGTSIEAFTNDYGDFALRNVPVGTAQVRVTYTGQAPVVTPVAVTADQTTTVPDIKIGQGEVAADGTVVLDQFKVMAERMKNAREIAINEERYSVNIKNVISTDQFGDVANGNVGELVKFMPGVLVSYGAFGGNNQGYSDTDASGVSIRGFGPEDTAILIDGMPVANAAPGTLSRQVGLDMLAVNNASRVELIKVPTPDMPSNSPGGQINLITKSAFEYARPTLSGRVFFNFNSDYLKLNKTPGPTDKETHKITPGVELSVAMPLTPKFGVTVTGFWNREFNQSNRAEATYTYTGSFSNSAGPISLSNPMLTRFKVTDSPRTTEKQSGNIKFDWRPTPSQMLTANVQYSTYTSVEAQRRLDLEAKTVANANWGPDFATTPANASNKLDMTVTTRDKIGDTTSGALRYSYRLGGWDISASGSYSISNSEFVDRANGHFSEVTMKLDPGAVNIRGIRDGGIPSSIETFYRTNKGGGPVDYTQLRNWSVNDTVAKSGEASSRKTVGLYKVDVSRQLDFIPWLGRNTLVFQTGARRDQEKVEKWGLGTGYREILRPGMSFNAATVIDNDYLGISPGFGFPAQEWASSYALYEANLANNLFYAPEDGTEAVNNWNSYAGQQRSMTMTTDGYYGQLSGKFFKNRLSFLGGIRQEQRTNEGRGQFSDSKWDYAKLPSGLLYTEPGTYERGVRFSQAGFLTDAALQARMRAAGVVVPDHMYGPAASSLESAKLARVANRYVKDKVKSDPTYSLSASYELTKKIQFKAAWSRSLKLPNIEDGSNAETALVTSGTAFTINENVPVPDSGVKGNIRVANAGLMPETANNWDFEASYFTDSGGKFSVSYYMKTVNNQIQTFQTDDTSPVFNAVLQSLGLSPEEYQGWRLTTATNGIGSQKTSGYEFEVRQDFAFLGSWGKHFSAFGSITLKDLGDPVAVAPIELPNLDGTKSTYVPAQKTLTRSSDKFAGAGIQFSSRRLSVQVRGTYRNENEVQRTSLNGGTNYLRRYEPEETRVDINADFKLNKYLSLFANARDVLNSERKNILRDDLGLYPSYAELYDVRRFGVQWTVGVKGSF